ncbi:MAG: hypothetical protein WCK14_08815 [Actinomycetota bacterium]|jgi:hypothetical protein
MTDVVERPIDKWATVRLVVVLTTLAGAQIVHWSLIDQSSKEWHASGVFFFAVAALEALAAVAVLFNLNRWVAAFVVAISAFPAVVWAWENSFGLPFGPANRSSGLGRSDVLSIALEVATVVAIWPFMRPGYGARRPAKIELAGKIIMVSTVVYVAVFSFWAIVGDSASNHGHTVKRSPSGVTSTTLDISSITQPTLPPVSTP